ncbi:MAG: hypothetical protein ABSA71_09635 [Desulfomonilia bacterium]|jgi:uncharacterized membrane-anchored protein YhcB (DUF1043 family)
MAKNKVATVILVIGLFIGGAVIGFAANGMEQPHMRAALESLKDARKQLEQAEHNKGGHREKAIKLVDKAVEQVIKGIEAGERGEKY